ncbi:class I SAM-dependent methyltransferase [Steroidobacter flavus]|uniref:Class I SAM-dependent methyltransferase n=1 Tax=Steroidobacter flavus TaxID=1842136 RepID=A0ABV8SWE5_9GAMM
MIVNLVAPRVWGCDPDILIDHYRDHVTSNHADIGVGTGFFLDRCGLPSATPRLALIDLQPNCLEHTARRLSRYRPSTYLRDVLSRVDEIPGGPFDSVALPGIIHCLAGDLTFKSRVFDNIAPLTRPGTKLFGYTLVYDGVRQSASRRLVHPLLNRLRVIDNANDHLGDLRHALSTRYIDCNIQLVGCMALFSAVVPTAASIRR